MNMRDAVHIPEDDLIQYALGTLPELQLGNLTAHISLCNQCRAELGKIQVELASFATVMPLEELPAGARDRFFKKVNASAAEMKSSPARKESRMFFGGRPIQEWFLSPMPFRILSGALAAALLFVAYDDVTHIHQIRELLPEMKRFEAETSELMELKEFLHGAGAQQVALHEKPLLQKAPEGHALYAASSGKLIFTAANMPAVPVGKAYELWVIPAKGGAPIPAGTFKPDLQGNAAVIFPPLPANVQAGAFGVTIEDEAGSKTPTTPIILSGQ